MKQYKATLGEDLASQFYQKISGGLKEIRYAATPELAIKLKTRQVSVQTEELYVNTSITSEVWIIEPWSQEAIMLTSGTPSRKIMEIATTVLSAIFVMGAKWMINMV